MDVGEQLRRHSRRKKRLGIAFLLLAVLSAAVIMVFMLTYITDVRVIGNRYISGELIEKQLFGEAFEQRLLYAMLRDKLGRNPRLSGVRKYSLSFLSDHSVQVDVTENEPVGAVIRDGLYAYFDETGYVLYEDSSGQAAAPLVKGLAAENAGAGETLEFEKPGNAAVIRLLSLLSASGIRPDEVAYAGNGEVTLSCGSLKVLLGGSRQIEDKIGDLADILNSGRLAGLSGILHLEEFDESSAYIFEQTG